MEPKQSFSIDFIIRKCKANKKRADIYARITVDGDEKELSIKEQIDTDDWNSSKEMVRGKSIEVRAINEHINDARFRIKEKFRELERTEQLITAGSVKAEDKKETDIARHMTHSCIPWPSILYNMKRLEERGLYYPPEQINSYINRFEIHRDPGIVQQIRNKILGNTDQSKADFIEALIRIFDTRSSTDIVHELGNLSLNADNLIHESLQKQDMEGLLLAALALSDISLVYQDKPLVEGMAPLIKEQDKELLKRLRNYKSSFLNDLNLKKGQLLIWLFKYDNKYGALLVTDEEKITAQLLPAWNEDKLDEWVNKIASFHFNSSNHKLADYDLNTQEKDYQNWLDFFSFSQLPALPLTSELLIGSSIEMTNIPHNLLVLGNDFTAATNL